MQDYCATRVEVAEALLYENIWNTIFWNVRRCNAIKFCTKIHLFSIFKQEGDLLMRFYLTFCLVKISLRYVNTSYPCIRKSLCNFKCQYSRTTSKIKY